MSSCGNCLAHKHIIKMLHHQHMLTKDLFPCLALLRVISSAELAATISYLSTNTIHQSHFMSTTHTHTRKAKQLVDLFFPQDIGRTVLSYYRPQPTKVIMDSFLQKFHFYFKIVQQSYAMA